MNGKGKRDTNTGVVSYGGTQYVDAYGAPIQTPKYRAAQGKVTQTAEQWLKDNDFKACWKHRNKNRAGLATPAVQGCKACFEEWSEVAPVERLLAYVEGYLDTDTPVSLQSIRRSSDWDIENLDVLEQQKRLLRLLNEGVRQAEVARMDEVTRAAITNRLKKVRKRLEVVA